MHVNAVMHSFCIGYSSGDVQMLIKDIGALKPTIFGSFPAFYNKIYQVLMD